MATANNKEWWRGGIVYQIYPRSFMDSNGDGIGDLPGITNKLDYVASLGVDGVWISPFFMSPMKDFGYDVSDYRDVDPMFGTLDDFRKLLDKAHGLGLKIIMDLVMSHTSDQHAWFKESRQSRDNPKTDWYVWADPNPDGTPPNNWQSVFGGPAWTFETHRGQFYMHNFLKEQPDLNFHNIEVQDMMLDTAKFWLDFGVDGFRLDALNHCFHDKELRNNPPKNQPLESRATQVEFLNPYNMQKHLYDKSQPEMFGFLKRLRKLAKEYNDAFLLAEIGDDEPIKLAAEYTSGPDLLHTAYNFSLLGGQKKKLTPGFIKGSIQEHQQHPGRSWPSWAFSNHDVTRVLSRWGSEYDCNPEFAKTLTTMLTCLRGSVYIYQGEELGLTDAIIPYDKIQDPWGKVLWPEWQGRDGCRTPMPWNNEKNAGFSPNEPWLPIPDEHIANCVETQDKNKNSVLNYTRRFIHWRKEHSVLRYGEIEFPEIETDSVLIFSREFDNEKMLCLFNLSDREAVISLNIANDNSHFDAGTLGAKIDNDGNVILPPFGIYVGYASPASLS